MAKDVVLIDKLVDFLDAPDGGLIIKHSQEIPQEHLDALQIAKAETIGTPMGDFHRLCSIPTGVVDQWLLEGFDVMKEDAPAIMKRLRKHELDKFITTTKRIY